MTRFLTILCLLLGVLCLLQAHVMRQVKRDLAGVDHHARHAAMADLRDRKDEIHRFLAWLTQTLTERPVSSYRVCSADGPDLNTLDTLLFDTYLTARAEGKDEATARQRVLDALAQRKPAGLP